MSRWSWLFDEIVEEELHYEDCIRGKGCTCVAINDEIELTDKFSSSFVRKIPLLNKLHFRDFNISLQRNREREKGYSKLI